MVPTGQRMAPSCRWFCVTIPRDPGRTGGLVADEPNRWPWLVRPGIFRLSQRFPTYAPRNLHSLTEPSPFSLTPIASGRQATAENARVGINPLSRCLRHGFFAHAEYPEKLLRIHVVRRKVADFIQHFVSTNRMSPVAGAIDLVPAPRGRVTGPDRHEIERPSVFVRRCHPGSPFQDGVQLALQRPMVTARQTLQRMERLGRHVPDMYRSHTGSLMIPSSRNNRICLVPNADVACSVRTPDVRQRGLRKRESTRAGAADELPYSGNDASDTVVVAEFTIESLR